MPPSAWLILIAPIAGLIGIVVGRCRGHSAGYAKGYADAREQQAYEAAFDETERRLREEVTAWDLDLMNRG
jgi:hypothetical protein